MRRRSSIAATLLLLVVAVSCSGGADERRDVGSAPASTDDASGKVSIGPATTKTDEPTADAAIDEFDDAPLALAPSLGAINESALADPDALRAAALVGLGAGVPNRRFASVLALTMTASTADPASIEALRTLSNSPDVTERLLAAGALASVGDRDGVGVLIDALVSEELAAQRRSAVRGVAILEGEPVAVRGSGSGSGRCG